MKEFKSQNGKVIVINSSSMKTVKKLRKCLAQELLKHKIDLGNPKSVAELTQSLKGKMVDIVNLLKDILLGLEVSDEFEAVIYECMKECTYDNIMITESLFDDIQEAREDYDKIVMEVIKENLYPFIKSLIGKFSINDLMTEESQE